LLRGQAVERIRDVVEDLTDDRLRILGAEAKRPSDPVDLVDEGEPLARPRALGGRVGQSTGFELRPGGRLPGSTRGVDDEGFAVCVGDDDGTDHGTIIPGDTLQKESAREEDDERHICPLQLQVIRRAIELWTNPGDVVLSLGSISVQTGEAYRCHFATGNESPGCSIGSLC
jgi:hypothetical protein